MSKFFLTTTFSVPPNSEFPRFFIYRALGGMWRVQKSCDICTRLARFLYSTKERWIINRGELVFKWLILINTDAELLLIAFFIWEGNHEPLYGYQWSSFSSQFGVLEVTMEKQTTPDALEIVVQYNVPETGWITQILFDTYYPLRVNERLTVRHV